MFSLSKSITSRCRRLLLRSLPFSTSSSWAAQETLFPFPARRNPTPHEIFHLPRNATEADIKSRYFDLVRLYHPDKATDVPADAAHVRFQAITRAYDALRGKVEGGTSDLDVSNPNVDLRYQTTAAWRAAQRRRQHELYSSGAADDKWKDRIILFGVISTIVFVVANTLMTRKEVVVDALNRTRQTSYPPSPPREPQQRRMVEDSRLSAEPEPGSRS